MASFNIVLIPHIFDWIYSEGYDDRAVIMKNVCLDNFDNKSQVNHDKRYYFDNERCIKRSELLN